MPLIDLTEQEIVRLCEGLARRPRGIMTPEDHALTNKLRNPQEQVWEPVEDGFAWADDDGDYTSMELSDWRQKIHADYANSRISEIFTLPDNIRLCRLVEQEREP